MPGPNPKDPAKRARTNKAASRAVLTADERDATAVPDMGTLDSEDWHPLTVAWWQDVWTSPMAKQFLSADKHSLYRLLLMVQEFWRRPNVELSKDIDKAQQAFGLTPLDRRRLEWVIENPAPKQPSTRDRRPANVVPINPLAALQ